MKIFSNFDTHSPLEQYQKALSEYGADKVIFVRRHRIYLLFFITLPSVAVGILLIFAFLAWRNVSLQFLPSFIGNIVFTVLFTIIAFMVVVKITLNYINYLLDFTIVTPRLITSYNQTGLFRREVRTIDTDKIKAITVSGKTFLQSVFNYGSIIFLSEGDEDDYGDIVLHFLKNPNVLKDDVVRVIDLKKDD